MKKQKELFLIENQTPNYLRMGDLRKRHQQREPYDLFNCTCCKKQVHGKDINRAGICYVCVQKAVNIARH